MGGVEKAESPGVPWLLENLKEVVIAYRELLG